MYPKSSKVTQTQHLYALAFSESFCSLTTFEQTVARSQSSAKFRSKHIWAWNMLNWNPSRDLYPIKFCTYLKKSELD